METHAGHATNRSFSLLFLAPFSGNKKISPENHMQGMLMYLKEKMKLVDPDEERNMTVTQHIDDLYEKIQLLGKTDGQVI